jgi:hypothetical protein
MKSIIAKLVAHASGIPLEDVESILEVPKDTNLGDYALPCFSFAKKMRKSPVEIAKDLAHKINSKELDNKEINNVLTKGVDWAIEKGYGTKQDKELCENEGVILDSDASKVSQKAKGRGMNQLGTLGAGKGSVADAWRINIQNYNQMKGEMNDAELFSIGFLPPLSMSNYPDLYRLAQITEQIPEITKMEFQGAWSIRYALQSLERRADGVS